MLELADLKEILKYYDIGNLKLFKPLRKASVQHNVLIESTRGKFIVKYYLNRSEDYVKFEVQLLSYLSKHNFESPRILKTLDDNFFVSYKDKTLVLFEYIVGNHLEVLSEVQIKTLSRKLAEFHQITEGFESKWIENRINYSIAFCREEAKQRAQKLNTTKADEKLNWLLGTLQNIRIPDELTKGICHADLHPSNFLFEDNKLKAILDFDDANFTYYTWDLVNLMDYYKEKRSLGPDFNKGKLIIKAYEEVRPLSTLDKSCFFEVYKLYLLIDCLWYFERGIYPDFFEKKRIDYFDDLGKEFFNAYL